MASPTPEPAEAKADSPATKGKSKPRKRRASKGRSTKKKRRDGGGRPERKAEGGDDGRRKRTRAPRPASSPAPFIVAGVFVLVAVVIVAIVASEKNSPRSAGSNPGTGSSGNSTHSSGGSDATGYSAAPSAPAAPTRTRSSSASAEIRFVLAHSFGGDARYMTAACGACGTSFATRVEKCPKTSCAARVRWPKDNKKKCGFCCPRNQLKVDGLDTIAKNKRHGYCAFCGGSGKDPKFRPEMRRGLYGMDRTQPGGQSSSSGSGECSICKGSSKCMQCKGTGWVEIPETFGE
jgi:hypothetical protein